MTRLDHNRAMAQLAAKTNSHVNDIRRMTIWGNHSATQYPDVNHASVNGESAVAQVDQSWLADEFIPVVQQRGAAIIKARGASSAASAASAAIDHMHDWALGNYEIVQGLSIDDFSRGRMDATETELREERAAIESLL
jgi:malate dehydrogenase